VFDFYSAPWEFLWGVFIDVYNIVQSNFRGGFFIMNK
tara:strand:- start:527512 stop:527622 length:111 start_codon:yes stop_codon:yes gene_type:complete